MEEALWLEQREKGGRRGWGRESRTLEDSGSNSESGRSHRGLRTERGSQLGAHRGLWHFWDPGILRGTVEEAVSH